MEVARPYNERTRNGEGIIRRHSPFDISSSFSNQGQVCLSGSLWTKDSGRAHRLADRITSGTVWVNCWLLRDLRVPFGGMKSSGVGREGGEEALRFFTEPKNVCIRVALEGG